MRWSAGSSDFQLQLPVCQIPAGSAAPECQAEPQRLLAPAGLSGSMSPAPDLQSWNWYLLQLAILLRRGTLAQMQVNESPAI